MSNLGPHGEEVDSTDAIRVMRDVIDVLEWYVVLHDPSCRVAGDEPTRQSLEILPPLREKYLRYLQPEIASVRFVQSEDRCWLEITTAARFNDYLIDEMSTRTDLAFIACGSADDDPFFSPARSITENAHRFVSGFDAVSIYQLHGPVHTRCCRADRRTLAAVRCRLGERVAAGYAEHRFKAVHPTGAVVFVRDSSPQVRMLRRTGECAGTSYSP